MDRIKIDFNFLEFLAMEDYRLHCWKAVANEWMGDYVDYFEDNQEEDDESDYPDEGVDLVEPATRRTEMVRTSNVFSRREVYCVITTADIKFQNEWFQEESHQQLGQDLPQLTTSTVGTDNVGQSLKSTVSECNQQNEAILEIPDINTFLIQPLSPWEDEMFMKPQSSESERNTKEKCLPKSKTKSKSRNAMEKEHVAKKSKTHHPKNVTDSIELRSLLEKKDDVHLQINNNTAKPCTITSNDIQEIIMIQDESVIETNISSQDADLKIINQVIALKKSLIMDKNMVEGELNKKREEANMIQSQIDKLQHQVEEINRCVSQMEHERTKISNKLQLISEL